MRVSLPALGAKGVPPDVVLIVAKFRDDTKLGICDKSVVPAEMKLELNAKLPLNRSNSASLTAAKIAFRVSMSVSIISISA